MRNDIHSQSKVINTELFGENQILSDKDVLIRAKLTNSVSQESSIIDSILTNSSVDFSSVTNSALTESDVEYAYIHGSGLSKSSVDRSKIFHSYLNNSHVGKDSLLSLSRVRDSIISDSAIITEAYIVNSSLRGVIAEKGVRIEGVNSKDYGLYFKHGTWTRAPFRVSNENLVYPITEDVNDRILVGCISKSLDFWRSISREQSKKFGKDFWYNYHLYMAAIWEVANQKNSNKSPVVNDLRDTNNERIYEETENVHQETAQGIVSTGSILLTSGDDVKWL